MVCWNNERNIVIQKNMPHIFIIKNQIKKNLHICLRSAELNYFNNICISQLYIFNIWLWLILYILPTLKQYQLLFVFKQMINIFHFLLSETMNVIGWPLIGFLSGIVYNPFQCNRKVSVEYIEIFCTRVHFHIFHIGYIVQILEQQRQQ